MVSLRRALQVMVDEKVAVEQAGELRRLRRQIGHTIRIQASPHPIKRYSCLMHAFDFSEKQEYIEFALRDVFAGAEFAHWMMNRGHLKPLSNQEAKRGDVIFYLSGDEFKHAGLLIKKNRVLSKWGTFHLCTHAIFEVPSSYGRKIRYFKHLPYQDAFGHFTDYAREKGLNPDAWAA